MACSHKNWGSCWEFIIALASSTIVRFIRSAIPFCDGEYGAVVVFLFLAERTNFLIPD